MLFTNNSYQENNNNTINTNNTNTNNNNTINTNNNNTINTNNNIEKLSIFPKNMFIMASPSDKCVSCGH